MASQTIPRRDQVAIEHTWNAESVFASIDDWEAEFARVEAQIPDLAHFSGRLGVGPAALVEWFALADELNTALGKLQTYAVMSHAVDAADQQATARYERFAGLAARALAATSFAEPELLAIGIETLATWMRSEPRLAVYAHYFEQLARRSPHIRSAEVEELLGMVSEPFAAAAGTHGVLANADLRYAPARGATGETSGIPWPAAWRPVSSSRSLPRARAATLRRSRLRSAPTLFRSWCSII
jgi:oligoendopeptidase F